MRSVALGALGGMVGLLLVAAVTVDTNTPACVGNVCYVPNLVVDGGAVMNGPLTVAGVLNAGTGCFQTGGGVNQFLCSMSLGTNQNFSGGTNSIWDNSNGIDIKFPAGQFQCTALSSGTKAVTVTSGAACVCSSTTANAVHCAVSTTTLTLTGTGTDTVCYACNK
jgi:hypothetical protein